MKIIHQQIIDHQKSYCPGRDCALFYVQFGPFLPGSWLSCWGGALSVWRTGRKCVREECEKLSKANFPEDVRMRGDGALVPDPGWLHSAPSSPATLPPLLLSTINVIGIPQSH